MQFCLSDLKLHLLLISSPWPISNFVRHSLLYQNFFNSQLSKRLHVFVWRPKHAWTTHERSFWHWCETFPNLAWGCPVIKNKLFMVTSLINKWLIWFVFVLITCSLIFTSLQLIDANCWTFLHQEKLEQWSVLIFCCLLTFFDQFICSTWWTVSSFLKWEINFSKKEEAFADLVDKALATGCLRSWSVKEFSNQRLVSNLFYTDQKMKDEWLNI